MKETQPIESSGDTEIDPPKRNYNYPPNRETDEFTNVIQAGSNGKNVLKETTTPRSHASNINHISVYSMLLCMSINFILYSRVS